MTENPSSSPSISPASPSSIHSEQDKALTVSAVSKNVSTSEGDLHILEDISLDVSHGESMAIVGASGSGKSTLLGILAGLDSPSSGQVELMGKNITALDEEGRASVRSDYVGFVFQSFQLLPGLTALENVMLPLELAGGVSSGNAKEQAKNLLTRVGLEARLNHYPQQLSGGEQQRVAIARAFASHPKVLFADEPTGNLDTHTGAHIIELLFDLNREQGTTLILVTHEQRLADRCSKKILLDAGRIVSREPKPEMEVV
ncbi:MAG: ABC transporter ATP-binding protein [Cellvibrionaceae bacterium]